MISVIIPVYNGAGTIGVSLASVFSSEYESFEVVVVNDGSHDETEDIVRGFAQARYVHFEHNRGASAARNAGARAASGEVLFFMDADCVVAPGTLALVAAAYGRHPGMLIGGTYTPMAHDPGFFNSFQSVFIHYSETRRMEPDYVASHAMVIGKALFIRTRGFAERFLPIMEDVEYSHRIRRAGIGLRMAPEIQVGHVFGFDLVRSMKNAFRKARFWTAYSLGNGDIHRDSGTASIELKVNTLLMPIWAGLLVAAMVGGCDDYARWALWALLLDAIISRGFLWSCYKHGGAGFFLMAAGYYMGLYPLAVGAGGLAGVFTRR